MPPLWVVVISWFGTGGVGENQWATRRAVCENMEYMGMKIDVEKNEGYARRGDGNQHSGQ